MGVPESVGGKIRMYRKLKHISQEELAARIYKSKSILSKYELGQTSLDVATLCAIAAALGVSTADLLDLPEQTVHKLSGARFGIFQNDVVYLMAHFKAEGFWRGVLNLHDRPDGATGVKLYTVLPSFGEVDKCRAVYEGTLSSFPTNTAMLLSNVLDPADMTGLFVSARKGNYHTCSGLFVQFAYLNNNPAVTKTILSDVPLREDRYVQEMLTIGKDDIAQIKRTNIFSPLDYMREEQAIDVK